MGRRRLALAFAVVLGLLAASACATSGAVPRPYPGSGGAARPGGAPPPAESGGNAAGRAPAPSAVALEIVHTARALLGSPYRAGGTDPEGFDCSGFVQYVYLRSGVQVPRSVREQWEAGWPVATPDIAPGDLLFFAIDGTGVVSHVGIALGADTFVHAPSARGVVRVERLSAEYWVRRYAGARRIAATSTSDGDPLRRAGAPFLD